jgi:hypothetical protein
MDELGSVRDCIAAIDQAMYQLHIACAPEEALGILRPLHDHVWQSVDPKVARLLPTVAALLAAAAQNQAATPRQQALLRSNSWWVKWVWRFSDSFLRQWTVLFQHFLLVLSAVGFTAAIGIVLGRLHVHIQSAVEPVLNYTDLGLITVFCLEAFALLALTAGNEVLRKARLLRATPAAREQGAKRRAEQNTTHRDQGKGSSGSDNGAAAA